ncbi:MAG: hypothetical protein ACOYJC_04515 [Christensenellales bacterium]|jgi:hypothetical protein
MKDTLRKINGLRWLCILVGTILFLYGLFGAISPVHTQEATNGIAIITVCENEQDILLAASCKAQLSVALAAEGATIETLTSLALHSGLEVLTLYDGQLYTEADPYTNAQHVFSAYAGHIGSRGVLFHHEPESETNRLYVRNTQGDLKGLQPKYTAYGDDPAQCEAVVTLCGRETGPLAVLYYPGNAFPLDRFVECFDRVVFASSLPI